MAEAVVTLTYRQKLPFSRDEVDDCVTEFVETMWRKHVCGFAPSAEPCGYKRWVTKCARNYVIDYLRKLKRKRSHRRALPEVQLDDGTSVPLDYPDPSPLPEEIAFREEALRLIEMAGEGLTRLEREVFFRHHLDDWSAKDLAADLHISENAVYQMLHRAGRHLRSELEKRGIPEEALRELLATTPPITCIIIIQYHNRTRISKNILKIGQKTRKISASLGVIYSSSECQTPCKAGGGGL